MTDQAQPQQEAPKIRKPGIWLLIFGVIYPAGVIAFELVTHMCAEALFDPMPTPLHVVLVAAAPVVNLALWLVLRRDKAPSRWWALAGGAATAIALCYALVFLPLYPLAVVAVVLYGLGFLPFGPLSAFIAGLVLTLRANARAGGATGRAWIGAALGLIAINGLDIPAAVTRLALQWSASEDAQTRAHGVQLMRSAGDRNLLLRLCYDTSGRANGLISTLATTWAWFGPRNGEASLIASTTQAQELYYRVTGDPFNSVPPPYDGGPWSFTRAFEFDADQGGTEVGGRVRGLSLASSRIDASVDADDAVGYLEWTMEFANHAETQSEARLTLALPPHGVISRATLWVNGVAREAVVAGRAEARQAYERVVRRERRDPLLVTTQGADRALVQAFPVLPGQTLKIRIGVTVPLGLPSGDQAALILPAIADRNFSIGRDLRHAVWIEGDSRIVSAHASLTRETIGAAFRARGAIDDGTLARERPRLVAARSQAASTSVAEGIVDRAPSGAQILETAHGVSESRRVAARAPLIMQVIAPEPRTAPGAIMFVVDGSERSAPAFPALRVALAQIPPNAVVGLVVANEEQSLRVDPAPLTAAHCARLLETVSRARARGGQDNAGALAGALAALSPFDNAALVWIHAPQPVRFVRDAALLEQTLERSTRLPRLILYPVHPGPNRILMDGRWFYEASSVAASGDVEADLTGLVRELYARTPQWRVRRELAPAAVSQATNRSSHIARLWAHDRILGLAVSNSAEARREALQLAAAYRLVTPVSGAVVLETDADYVANNLTAPDASQIPTVPEPATWAMLLIACALLAFMAWRYRRLLRMPGAVAR